VSKETQKSGYLFGFIPSVEDFSDEDFKKVCEALFGPHESTRRFEQEYSEEDMRLIHADTTGENWNDIAPHLREIGRRAVQREREKKMVVIVISKEKASARNTESRLIKMKIRRKRIIDRPGFQLAMGAVPEREEERPPQEIERGRGPECGETLVANLYWHPEHGYLLRYECWESLKPEGRCGFYATP